MIHHVRHLHTGEDYLNRTLALTVPRVFDVGVGSKVFARYFTLKLVMLLENRNPPSPILRHARAAHASNGSCWMQCRFPRVTDRSNVRSAA